MGTDPNERTTPEYLAQLLKDKKQIQAFPNLFTHTERLLDDGLYVILFVHTYMSYFILILNCVYI